MAIIEIAKIQVRRGLENVDGRPQLDPGEFGWAQDTEHLWIGKSIAEGAGSDDPTRLLTDKDLSNIFELINYGADSQAHSADASYRYRPELIYGTTTGTFASTTTTIGRKLDNWISLSDFVGPGEYFESGDDITQVMRRAVKSIYQNDPGLGVARELLIPAGTFVIAGTIDLPPNAKITGVAKDITTIICTDTTNPLFRTVDALGNSYEDGMDTADNISQNVSVKNMTLAYSASNVNESPLISLDNTKEALVQEIKFTTINGNITTSTFVTTGTGIVIRGDGSDPSTAVSLGTKIEKCFFEKIGTGVKVLDYVARPYISNSDFENLTLGVLIDKSLPTNPLPQNALITGNTFRFIYGNAVLVEEATASGFTDSNTVCNGNSYYYVANFGSSPDDLINVATDAVLNFKAKGCASINDYFHRESIYAADPTTFFDYYNPLVKGYGKLTRSSPKSVDGNQINLPFLKLPLTGGDQSGFIDYQLNSPGMSRAGRLTVNISYDGEISISDQYTFSESVQDQSTKFLFNVSDTNALTGNFVVIQLWNDQFLPYKLSYTLDFNLNENVNV
jgi:hypothetical protein